MVRPFNFTPVPFFSYSSSFYSFRFSSFCLFTLFSLAFRSFARVFLRSVVSFSFLFFSPLPSVFLHCVFSLLLSNRFLLDSPSSALSAGSISLFFAFPPVVGVTCWSPFFLLLRAPSHSFPSLTFRIVALPRVVTVLQRCLRLCSPRLVVFSSAALASFSMYHGRGGLGCLCSLSTGVYAFSLVVFSGVYVAYSVFWLLSSVPPVSCTCFAAPDGLVGVVSYLSACCLALSITFPCRLGGLGFFPSALLS